MGKIIEKGEAVLIVHRRLYSDDQIRFFVGKVDTYDDGVARVTGYTWRRDPLHNGKWARKSDVRTKIVALASGTLIAYPISVAKIEDVEFVSDGGDSLIVRDGRGFEMDLSERVGT